MYRVAGKRAGAAVLIGDATKGFMPASVGVAVDGRPLGVACGVAAMVGHILPATRGFRSGGKGVATLGGACWFLYPLVALAAIAGWAIALRVFRIASVGSLLMAAILPIGVAVRGRPGWEVAVACGASALIVVRHRANITRILHGDEGSVTAR